MTKPLVVFIFQEVLMKHVIKSVPPGDINREFYESDLWETKPNSTSRLNVVNYQAVAKLADAFEVKFLCINEVSDDVQSVLRSADIVVVNQVSSPGSRAFVGKLLAWLDSTPIRGKVIFGTELSWFNELVQDRGITREMVDAVYFEHVVLRHTAKTEVPLYADERCHDAVIQEFEIGLDTDIVRGSVPVGKRSVISFVRAPEGRSTKNNSAIDRIISRIQDSAVLSRFEIRVMAPPYTSTDYWRLMGESAFFVFTSLGETFSYCLNDAKACGAVAFFPEQMYYTARGMGFAVEAYPRSGLRYGSDDELISTMEAMAEDPSAMELESDRSRGFVEAEFSVEAISRKWRKLFSGESLNDATLFIYDPRNFRDWTEVVSASRLVGATFAMPYLNIDVPGAAGNRLSWHDQESDVVMLRYYLTQTASDQLVRTIRKDEEGVKPGEGRIAKHLESEAGCFLQLICRQHKICRIVLDEGLADTITEAASKKLKYFAGIHDGKRDVKVELRSA